MSPLKMPVPRPGGPARRPGILPQVPVRRAHRIAAGILLGTALMLLVQLVTLFTISDDTLIAYTKFAMRKNRDQRVLQDLLSHRAPAGDGELDAFVESHREEILREGRKALTGSPMVWVGKVSISLLLGAIMAGLLKGRSRPTRILAGLGAVFLIVASILVVFKFGEALEALTQVGGGEPLITLIVSSLIPVSALCCFWVAGRALWVDRGPIGGPQSLQAVRPGRLGRGPASSGQGAGADPASSPDGAGKP